MQVMQQHELGFDSHSDSHSHDDDDDAHDGSSDMRKWSIGGHCATLPGVARGQWSIEWAQMS